MRRFHFQLLPLSLMTTFVASSALADVDPDHTVYVAQNTVAAFATSDLSAPAQTTLTLGFVAFEVALDPVQNVLYVGEQNGKRIFAFNAKTFAAVPALDITQAADPGGALEIDPFRRVLFRHAADNTITAYSIDASNYGTKISASVAVTGTAGTDANQLSRDPLKNWLFSAATEAGDNLVRVYDLKGLSFKTFTFPAGTSTGIKTNNTSSIAVDPVNSQILVQGSGNGGTRAGVERYDYGAFGTLTFNSLLSLHAGTNRDNTNDNGLHVVRDGTVAAVVETDYSGNHLFATNLTNNTFTIYSPLVARNNLAVEFYPFSLTEADDDADGLPDSVELGATGLTRTTLNDGDPTTTTDPDDSDSDDDGILDGTEDKNHNGVLDTGESNPKSGDSDSDGIPDGTEDADHDGVLDTNETDPAKSDTDGDGIADNVETSASGSAGPFVFVDTDSDGIVDARDLDSDNDCVPDATDPSPRNAQAPSQNANANCSGGLVCNKLVGQCVAGSPDAGIDAGPVDSGVDSGLDGGPRDSGPDSSVGDGSVGDGSTPDGSVVDGSTTQDGGGSKDGGVTNPVDSDDGSLEGGGIDCSTSSGSGGSGFLSAGVLAGLVVWMRKRAARKSKK